MVRNIYIGPLYKSADYSKVNLEFRPTKININASEEVLGLLQNVSFSLGGLACGIQATWVKPFRQQLIGSGVFVAPGVVVSAWHIFNDFMEAAESKGGTLDAEFQAVCMASNNEALFWNIKTLSQGYREREINDEIPASKNRPCDLTVLTCHFSGNQPKEKILSSAHISSRMPLLGEKLSILGLRENRYRAWGKAMELEVYLSHGRVIDVYPDGLSHVPGPCFALSTGAVGGMSGAGVFDCRGAAIGILSTGVEAYGKDNDSGYSIVSSIAPVFDQEVNPSWRHEPLSGPVALKDLNGVNII